jgi:Skp family chaperone for outer membrane proteins
MSGSRKIVATIVVGCSLVAAGAFAANQKILSVDVQKVFEEYEDAKASRATYSDSVTAANKEFKEMYDSVVKLQEEIGSLNEKAENTALLDSAREKFRSEAAEKLDVLRIKEEELLQFRQEINKKFAERRNRELLEQGKEIENATAEIAKAKKAEIVLTRVPSTLYVDESLDITQQVIDKLNEKKDVKKK